MLTFTASDPGSAGEGLTISLTATSVDGTTTPILPVSYGATSSTGDNTSAGDDVIVTFVSNKAGVTDNTIGLPATSATSGTFSLATISHVHDTNGGVPVAITELHSNYKPNAGTGKRVAGLSGDYQSDESWNDVTYPEDDNYAANETITTAAVALKSRLTWLASS